MNRFLLTFVLALALAPVAAGAGASPLQQRLITRGEIPDYTPLAAHTYGLSGYARAAGLDPEAKAKLAHAGFVSSAVENLRAPTALPTEAGPSQSSVVEFASAEKASSFATWLEKMYSSGGTPLPAGVHRGPFTIANEQQVLGLHFWGQTKEGRLDEYSATFLHGRYLDEIDLYVKGGRLTTPQARSEIGAHFKRLSPN
jgi:hypothetical protein